MLNQKFFEKNNEQCPWHCVGEHRPDGLHESPSCHATEWDCKKHLCPIYHWIEILSDNVKHI